MASLGGCSGVLMSLSGLVSWPILYLFALCSHSADQRNDPTTQLGPSRYGRQTYLLTDGTGLKVLKVETLLCYNLNDEQCTPACFGPPYISYFR